MQNEYVSHDNIKRKK